MARLCQTGARICAQIGVIARLLENASHTLKHAGVHISRAHTKVRGDLALHLRALDEVALVIDLLDHPDGTRDCDALSHGWRLHDGSQLLGLRARRVLLVLGKRCVETEVVCHALARKAHDETARLGTLDLVGLHKVSQQSTIVICRHTMEGREGEHAARKVCGGEFTRRGKRRHGLMVEKAVGQAVQPWGLNPALLHVELHERDTLHELPRYGLGQKRPGLGLVFAHHEPHLAWLAASAGAPHALQERAHRERGINLEGPLQATDVNAELERRGSDRCEVCVLVTHELIGRLPEACREIAVVDEEAVRLPHRLAVLAQRSGDGFTLLTGVGEDQALAAARVLEDVGKAGVREDGRPVSGSLGFRLLRLGCSDAWRDVLHALFSAGHALLGSRLLGSLVRCLRWFPTSTMTKPILAALRRLRPTHVEVLHRETPPLLGGLQPGDDASTPRTCREIRSGCLRVTDGG